MNAEESAFTKFNIKLKSYLNTVVKDGEVQGYVGVTANDQFQLLTLNRKTLKIDQEELKIANSA
jgi:hypothetical protein